MHVLVIPSWYPKSSHDISGSFFREQTLSLVRQDCHVGVITLQLRSLKQLRTVFTGQYFTTIENDEGINTYRKHGMCWFPRMRAIQARIWRYYGMKLFKRYVANHGMPDIVHVHSMLNAGMVALEIKKRYGIPYVITEHSSAFARGLVSNWQLNNVVVIAQGAERRMAVSTCFAQLLEKAINVTSSRWDVMPNIVHESFFTYSVGDKSSVIFKFLNVCLLTYNKRVDLLIKSFSKAFKGKNNIHLQIGGDGVQRQVLEALVKEVGLERQVEFLGMLSREQVVKYMSDANVFALSSQYETFGVVLIEALALGKPIIATRCGGPEDIVNIENGILVPTDDVDAMASAMQEMYDNWQSYDANEIRNACKVHFSEQSVAKKNIKIYEEVLSPPIFDPEI